MFNPANVAAAVGLVLAPIALGASPRAAQAFDFGGTNVFEHAIPNTAGPTSEGKSMVAILVTYPPGGKSPPHHHARSAFIYAYVLSGAVRSQVDDEPAKTYQAGTGFYEMPGARHQVSENASAEKPASLLAIYVVNSKDKPLTAADQE